MFEKIFILLDQFLSAQVAVLVEEVDFEDLLAVGGVCVSEDVGDEEGEDVAESAVADVGGEGVVVVGVEELNFVDIVPARKLFHQHIPSISFGRSLGKASGRPTQLNQQTDTVEGVQGYDRGWDAWLS